MAQTSNRETLRSIRRRSNRKQTDATARRCVEFPEKRNVSNRAELSPAAVARCSAVGYPGGVDANVAAGRKALPKTNSQNNGMHRSGVASAAAIAKSWIAAL